MNGEGQPSDRGFRNAVGEGFELALRMGADFLAVGMFDFQVKEDASVMRGLLASDLRRERPWQA